MYLYICFTLTIQVSQANYTLNLSLFYSVKSTYTVMKGQLMYSLSFYSTWEPILERNRKNRNITTKIQFIQSSFNKWRAIESDCIFTNEKDRQPNCLYTFASRSTYSSIFVHQVFEQHCHDRSLLISRRLSGDGLASLSLYCFSIIV